MSTIEKNNTRIKEIKITDYPDLTIFVNKATAVDGDVTARRGKYCIDAKSLMGVLSLDLSQGAVIEYPKDAEDFEIFIRKYEF